MAGQVSVLPVPVILAAVDGDESSLAAVAAHFRRYIRGLRVYCQAQNLLTFTNFSGLDPEGVSNIYAAQYPMSRQFTFGLDINF